MKKWKLDPVHVLPETLRRTLYATVESLWDYQGQTTLFMLFQYRKGVLITKRINMHLTLKMPRKPASENDLCLLNILANFSNLFLHTGKWCGP